MRLETAGQLVLNNQSDPHVPPAPLGRLSDCLPG
jgi:hypothetical protein